MNRSEVAFGIGLKMRPIAGSMFNKSRIGRRDWRDVPTTRRLGGVGGSLGGGRIRRRRSQHVEILLQHRDLVLLLRMEDRRCRSVAAAGDGARPRASRTTPIFEGHVALLL